MIPVPFDLPPPLFPIAVEEQTVDFDPTTFDFTPDDFGGHLVRSHTTNVPSRSMRFARSIGSPWRVQTSASAIDRTLDIAAAEGDRELGVPGQLAEVRRLTGYSWEQLARLMSCTRQAAHLWMNGEAITDANRDRLARLHATVRYFDRGAVDDNRAVLDMAADGTTVAELLRQERFDEARSAAGKGSGRQDAAWSRPSLPEAHPDDHWYSRLALAEERADNAPIRAKPQTTKRLQLRKG